MLINMAASGPQNNKQRSSPIDIFSFRFGNFQLTSLNYLHVSKLIKKTQKYPVKANYVCRFFVASAFALLFQICMFIFENFKEKYLAKQLNFDYDFVEILT